MGLSNFRETEGNFLRFEFVALEPGTRPGLSFVLVSGRGRHRFSPFSLSWVRPKANGGRPGHVSRPVTPSCQTGPAAVGYAGNQPSSRVFRNGTKFFRQMDIFLHLSLGMFIGIDRIYGSAVTVGLIPAIFMRIR
jgi:hypothetical protein